MQMDDYAPLVEITRGSIVESVHFGAFCVVARDGKVLAQAGNPDLLTYPRSSLKPLQVLAFLEQGGAQRFGLEEEEIAILCGSHAGTQQHSTVLERMHQKIGISEADLACGIHWPYDAATRDEMKLNGVEPTALNHNCSGKHTGMLALARLRGDSTENYLDLSHPVQTAIRATVGQMVGMDPDEMPVGIDGCSAPVYAVPMVKMAQGIARLADPAGLSDVRQAACRSVTSAMMSNPLMVAGPHQFDTDLMTVGAGKIFSKGGAEGYLIIGVIPGVISDHSPGICIAIKISDGDARGRARTSVGLTLLAAMGVLNQDDLDRMSGFGNVPITNWRDLTVGEVRTGFTPPDFAEMWA